MAALCPLRLNDAGLNSGWAAKVRTWNIRVKSAPFNGRYQASVSGCICAPDWADLWLVRPCWLLPWSGTAQANGRSDSHGGSRGSLARRFSFRSFLRG
jgi:hypothetical protein